MQNKMGKTLRFFQETLGVEANPFSLEGYSLGYCEKEEG